MKKRPQICYAVARDRVSWGTPLGNGTRKSFSDDIQTESVGEGVPGTDPAILGKRLLGLQEEGDWEVTAWWLCPAWRQCFPGSTRSHGNVQRQQEVNNRWTDGFRA